MENNAQEDIKAHAQWALANKLILPGHATVLRAPTGCGRSLVLAEALRISKPATVTVVYQYRIMLEQFRRDIGDHILQLPFHISSMLGMIPSNGDTHVLVISECVSRHHGHYLDLVTRARQYGYAVIVM